MKLVPFPIELLRLGQALPFGLRDGTGRLLLRGGVELRDRDRFDDLIGMPLFADEAEAVEWERRRLATMDSMLRRNAKLKEVVAARPAPRLRESTSGLQLTLAEEWEEIVRHHDEALRDVRAGSDWGQRLDAAHARARALAARRPDASLYWLVYQAGHSSEKYSSHHAVLTMLVAELTASVLGWPAPLVESLGRAALVMNVSMLRLQDRLALTQRELTASMRAEIDAHPAAGARLLEAAGCADRLVLGIVRHHHEAGGACEVLADLPPELSLARLLRRVDIFAAKISCRATRAPLSPVQAAREACLGAGGVPDEIGAALFKVMGLYPPGSFVELASGEIGIVVGRGRRANLPCVASLVTADGMPLGEPALRDTIDKRFAVKSAVPPARVRVRPPHDRLLAMR